MNHADTASVHSVMDERSQNMDSSLVLYKMLQFDIGPIAVHHLLPKLFTVKNSPFFGPPTDRDGK